MNMIRCVNGNFYDLDCFMFCSHCNQAKNEVPPNPFLMSMKSNKTIHINKEIFSIGRDSKNSDFCITDNVYVARNHAAIFTRDGKYFVVDKNSTNKTFVDGKEIVPNKEVEIMNSTKIRFANEDFVFHCKRNTTEEKFI